MRDSPPPSLASALSTDTERRTTSMSTSDPVAPPNTDGSALKAPRRTDLEARRSPLGTDRARKDPLRVRPQDRPQLVLADVTVGDERRPRMSAERRDSALKLVGHVGRDVAARSEKRDQRLFVEPRRRGDYVPVA